MEYENLIFELELLGGAEDLCAEKYLLPLQSGRLSLPVRLTPNDLCYLQAAACLREVEEASRSKLPGYELLVKGALLRFLALLIAQGKQQPLQRLPTPSAENRSAMALGPLCRGASGRRCCRGLLLQRQPLHAVVPADDGAELHRFSERIPPDAAAEALQTTDETILTIASRCGFENLSYFNRAFKAHFGMTPREYRKK